MGGYGDNRYGQGAYGDGDPIGDGPTVEGSLLDRVIGELSLAIGLGDQLVPLSASGLVTIRRGRTTPDQQPAPATCTLTVRRDDLAHLPAYGDVLTVDLGADAADWLLGTGVRWSAMRHRFRGSVTDVRVKPQNAVNGPSLVTVTAVSPRAKVGRVYVGDEPWPAELDGARAARVLALVADAQSAVTVGAVDPGQVTVLARDVDRQPAQQLLDALAVDTGGALAELRDGAQLWHDAEHRRATVPAVTLDADNVLAPAESTQSLAGVVNDFTVAYGPEPQATVRVVDVASVESPIGRVEVAVSTQLAEASDADSYARTTVARRARPRWSTPGLTVDLLRTVDVDTAARCLALEFADLLAVDGLPASGPFSAAQLWVEGATETIGRREWRLALDVSDYALTGPPLRWSDLPADLTWSDLPADLTWLAARSLDNFGVAP